MLRWWSCSESQLSVSSRRGASLRPPHYVKSLLKSPRIQGCALEQTAPLPLCSQLACAAKSRVSTKALVYEVHECPGSCAAAYREITLVPNEHDGHVGVCMLPGIFKPAGKVVEGLSPAIAHLLSGGGLHSLRCTRAQRFLLLRVDTCWMLELAPADVVHQQRSCCTSIVRARDGPEGLLPCLHRAVEVCRLPTGCLVATQPAQHHSLCPISEA